jgi:RNA recognition motif-containing protein
MDTKLYVGNFSQQVTEKALRGLFSRAGKVVSVDVIKDPNTGLSKGFAFIEMHSQSEAEKVLSEYDGFNLNQRPLRVRAVEMAKKRQYHKGR